MSTLSRKNRESGVGLRPRGGNQRSTRDYFQRVVNELRALGAKSDIDAQEMLCSGPGSSQRKLLEAVLSGKRGASAGSIYNWAQTAARFGVEWSSGPLALAMTGFPAQSLGVLGTALADGPSDTVTGLWQLLGQLANGLDVQAIFDPKYFRIRCFGKLGIDPGEDFGEYFDEFAEIWTAAEQFWISQTKLKRKFLRLSPESLDAIDEAWQKWSSSHRVRDFVPEPFVRAIMRLSGSDIPADPILVSESWTDISLFLEQVNNRGFESYGPRFQTWHLINSRAITRSLENATLAGA